MSIFQVSNLSEIPPLNLSEGWMSESLNKLNTLFINHNAYKIDRIDHTFKQNEIVYKIVDWHRTKFNYSGCIENKYYVIEQIPYYFSKSTTYSSNNILELYFDVDAGMSLDVNDHVALKEICNSLKPNLIKKTLDNMHSNNGNLANDLKQNHVLEIMIHTLFQTWIGRNSYCICCASSKSEELYDILECFLKKGVKLNFKLENKHVSILSDFLQWVYDGVDRKLKKNWIDCTSTQLIPGVSTYQKVIYQLRVYGGQLYESFSDNYTENIFTKEDFSRKVVWEIDRAKFEKVSILFICSLYDDKSSISECEVPTDVINFILKIYSVSIAFHSKYR